MIEVSPNMLSESLSTLVMRSQRVCATLEAALADHTTAAPIAAVTQEQRAGLYMSILQQVCDVLKYRDFRCEYRSSCA